MALRTGDIRGGGRGAAVLRVRNPAAAAARLAGQIGFVPDRGGDPSLLWFGGQAVRLCAPAEDPAGLIRLPFDHLALAVPDVDTAVADGLSRGAVLDRAYTPDGPREIAAFWEAGVRFAFLAGPEGAPIEICTRLGAGRSERGHDHFGIRVADFAASEALLRGHGGRLMAEHRLDAPGRSVTVRFWRLGDRVFELFDEPAPVVADAPAAKWIGWQPV